MAHNVWQVSNFGMLILGRQYYVEHSYNSSHTCVGIFPYREGTLVFYIESTSTDQVAGIASGLRHVIGREQLKEQMLMHLERMGKSFGVVTKVD